MAGSFTDYTENKVLDHVVGKTSFTMPSTWLALFTVAPTDAGGGTEVTGGSYARKATTGADWSAASGGATTNANALAFVVATGSWGTIVAAALMDAATAGNMLVWGDLAVNKTVSSGDTLSFAAGDIDFSLS
jgi:hypothetical protein